MPPLAGSLVLDLTDEPLLPTGRYLADLGARVVRLEPLEGQDERRRGPFLEDQEGPEHSLAHLLYNTGKQSVALDLNADASWAIVDRLAAAADLVLAPAEKSARMASFLARLGDSGPSVIDVVLRRDRPNEIVSDLAAVAAGGLLYCCGFPDVAPDYPAGKLAYKQGAYIGLAAAVAAIFDRRLRGRQNNALISLQEATASTTIQAANQNIWRWWGAVCQRAGTGGLDNRVLGQGFGAFASGNMGSVKLVRSRGTTFQSADGRWLTFMANPVRWADFAEWYRETMSEGYGLADPQWDDATFRVEHPDELDVYVREFCASLPRDELVQRAQAGRHYATPVQDVQDIADDPHLKQRDYFVEVDHPVLGRSVRKPRSPYRFSRGEIVPSAAPALGADTAAVLGELQGLTESGSRDLGSAGDGTTAEASIVPVGARGRPGPLPLSGYRALDFCWMAAGPLITELLANLGADVIKIESASGIDQVREFVHPPKGFSIDTGGFFADCNTGKRSLTLNLHNPDTITFIKEQLLPRVDMVTSNFAPDAMDRWGLGATDLLTLRPELVVGSFPVMGHSGPKTHWRAIGMGVLALSGIAAHMGAPDRPPVGMGTLHTDFTLAPIAAAGLMAALLEREETGRGQALEIAQYEASVHLLDTELIEQLSNGKVAPRRGNRSTQYVPHGIYPTAGNDRWVALVARNDDEWNSLCQVMGRPDLAGRPDLSTVEGRRVAEDEIDTAIGEWTAAADEWKLANLLSQHGVSASPLENVGDQVERDASLDGYYFAYERDDVPFLAHQQPFTWNGARLLTTPSPGLGEHNLEILQGELGLTDEFIADLVIREIVH